MFKLLKVQENDIERLRIIRNSCREYMTRNSKEINVEQQRQWFASLDKSKMIPYIFTMNNHEIGYGIISYDQDRCLLTGGLLPEYRNKGYGKNLFLELINLGVKSNCRIELEVLKTNTRALKTYQKLGFEIYSNNDKVYLMEYKEKE